MHEGPLKAYRALVGSGALAADVAQARVVDALQRLHDDFRGASSGGYVLAWRKKSSPRGLYIHGAVGRGKSMLMDLFFETAPVRHKRRVHFHAFMLETHDAIGAWRKLDPKARLSRARALGLKSRGAALDDPMPAVAAGIARHARLLCFDEFHVSDVADAMILGRLTNALFDQGVTIVATSNRAPDALYADGLNRQLFLPFIDLLKRELDVIALDGVVDYRLERLRGVTVYHTPLGPDADAAMDSAWQRLTDSADGAPCELKVKGRRLRVPKAAQGVARFDFSMLCARAHGAADYLALVHAFHTLLLDRIPEMRPENRNEARRFATLVDALYDRRCRLICSAAATPDALYRKGDGAYEFQRTVSRLIEMQSADYLGLGPVAAAVPARYESSQGL